jgi:hypothetical protein
MIPGLSKAILLSAAFSAILAAHGCGDDGNPCTRNSTMCGNQCVVLEYDVDHCGECFNPCNQWGDCIDGVCTCVEGHANCDDSWDNGCEVHLGTDMDNCGSCGNECATDESCIEGACH